MTPTNEITSGTPADFKDQQIHFLNWFHNNADFGPAHGDVMMWMRERYVAETGKAIPDGYEYEE